ncbi:OmpH family outer membrane protein [bacterium]|nr:OmpH family outer membrane protein [bacterium]
MNKGLRFTAVAAFAFALGLGVNNFAMSELSGVAKIAVVDVQQVVVASSEVNDLRKENQEKTTELVSYIEKARKDVASTTDADKKKALEEKYSKELNNKREAFGQEYNQKMMSIQQNILNAVREQAMANNYDLVIAKDVVLYGGDDITESLKKSVAAIKPAANTKTNSKTTTKKRK